MENDGFGEPILRAILAVFGLAFHGAVDISIKRHVGFMNIIETEILNISPYDTSAWDHFRKQKDETRCFGKLINILGYVFWGVLILASIVLGCEFRGATS
jgi:hypothetical protein